MHLKIIRGAHIVCSYSSTRSLFFLVSTHICVSVIVSFIYAFFSLCEQHYLLLFWIWTDEERAQREREESVKNINIFLLAYIYIIGRCCLLLHFGAIGISFIYGLLLCMLWECVVRIIVCCCLFLFPLVKICRRFSRYSGSVFCCTDLNNIRIKQFSISLERKMY